ncbi:sensor histidine kinase [Mucilaginibacter limnophilus]|nr:histidine kinase [Mucilaginibacter limnophilus]
MSQITWGDLGSKFLYAFLVAWLFLWLNAANINIAVGFRTIRTSKFSHRLLINILLFLLVRWLFRLSGIPEVSALRPGRGATFLFNISLVLEVSFCILIAEIYRLFRKHQEQLLRNEMLLKINAEARFEVLKNQVNPHFLFNSLNTINAVIDKDVAAAKRFVNNMSQVYRHILNSSGRPVITLAEEMEFTTAYVSMLMERHADSISIEIMVPDEYNSLLLPPVSLQVLIENAVKHNVMSTGNPLKISVSAHEGCIVVSNKVSERKLKSPSTGTGLWNLDQRYRHLCSGTITISNNDGVFTVALPLLKAYGDKYVPV